MFEILNFLFDNHSIKTFSLNNFALNKLEYKKHSSTAFFNTAVLLVFN